MTTASEMKDRVLKKAADDGDFRARLLADPKAAIAGETGMSLPGGFNVAVHEDNATTTHLVLPPSPQLTETELAQVSGGADWASEARPA